MSRLVICAAVVFLSVGFCVLCEPARGDNDAASAGAASSVAAIVTPVNEARPTAGWTTAVPKTYCMDYRFARLRSTRYVERIAAHPPSILHVRVNTVFNSLFGHWSVVMQPPAYQREDRVKAVKAHAGWVREFVDAMHGAGVETVMPYQSSVFFFGNKRQRSGLWAFYDHWDDYAEFGIGPRPATDPTEWLYKESDDGWVQWPCINHPDWRGLLRMTTAWAARSGYDALFSDVNDHRCYGPSCQKAFRRYLCEKYSPADLQRLFGFASPEQVRMGEPGDGLLWVETLRFRGNSFAELFAELTAAGRRYVPDFFILPNSSSYADIDEIYKRRMGGQNIALWARACPIFMYEKNEQPGRFGRTAISDNFLQYKFAFANRIRAGVLQYNSQEPHSIALSNAEAAALGGGSFIHNSFNYPEVRFAYRKFFESSSDLLAGYSSYAQVAVAFFYEELFWENRSHLEQIFCLKDYLCNHHVLWDFVVPDIFTASQLAKYAVLVIPEIQHLSDAQVALLQEYVQAGGGAVLIGEVGRFTEEGARRDRLPLEEVLVTQPAEGVRQGQLGNGWVMHASRIEEVIQRPAFEIFQLSEDEANDTATIINMAAEAEATTKPRGVDRLLAVCEASSGRQLSVADESVSFTLRVAAYRRSDAGAHRMTVHLLNYDVPIYEHRKSHPEAGPASPESIHRSGPPVPAENVGLSIPLPAGWQVTSVRLRGPYAAPDAFLPFQVSHGRLLVTVPKVEIYEIVEVAAE